MSSKLQQVLSIANNARIDHENGHPRTSAPFRADQRALVRRAVARGWLQVTESSRDEVWAALTDAGRAELHRLRGELPTTV